MESVNSRLGIACDGRPAGWLAAIYRLVCAPLSRRRVKRELEAEDRYRKLVDLCPDAVLVECQGRCVLVNPSAIRLFGARVPADLIGRVVTDLLHADSHAIVEHCFREMRESGHPASLDEMTILTLDGRPVDVEACGVAAKHAGRDAFQLVLRGVTQRKQAEAAMRESQRRLSRSQEIAHLGTWELDLMRDELTWSDEVYRIFGLEPQEFGATYDAFLERVHPDDRALVNAAYLSSVQEGRSSYEVEHRIVPWNGTEVRWVLEKCEHIKGAEGRVIRSVGMVLDITERKRAEAALHLARDAAEDAKAAAEAANRAKDEFLAALSHELRTPLSPVLIAVGTMENDHSLPQHIRDDLSLIHRNLDLEVRLIDDLLDLNRVVRGKIELHRRPQDMHDKLSNVVEICHAELEAKRLLVKTDLRAEAHHVDGDAGRLQQVFWNLLKNAIKFTPDTGAITMRTSNPSDGVIRVEVADTGVGLDPGTIRRLFEPFEQGGREVTRKFGGLGLGLAICKNLVELHGGSITAVSDGKGQGATFIVELPTVPSPVAPSVESVAPPRESPARHPGMRILFVEDHADTLRLMGRLLTRMGHDVVPAASVQEALAAAQTAQGGLDLVLSDLGLPDGSGLDLMRQLRQRWNLTGIAISGFGMEEDLAESRAAGFIDHLTKPVQLAMLETTLRRFSGDRRPAISEGDAMPSVARA